MWCLSTASLNRMENIYYSNAMDYDSQFSSLPPNVVVETSFVDAVETCSMQQQQEVRRCRFVPGLVRA